MTLFMSILNILMIALDIIDIQNAEITQNNIAKYQNKHIKVQSPMKHKLKSNIIKILLIFTTVFQLINTHQAHESDSQIDNIFSYIIIIGGYVFVLIGVIIYRMEAHQQKIITFEEVYTKDNSSSGVVTESDHKFQDFNQDVQMPKKISEEDGNDSARRKKRKRKADRLSDRRNKQNNNGDEENGNGNQNGNEQDNE